MVGEQHPIGPLCYFLILVALFSPLRHGSLLKSWSWAIKYEDWADVVMEEEAKARDEALNMCVLQRSAVARAHSLDNLVEPHADIDGKHLPPKRIGRCVLPAPLQQLPE